MHWDEAHSTEGMIADYNSVITRAMTLPVPVVDLPAHLRDDGSTTLHALLEPFGIGKDLWGTI